MGAAVNNQTSTVKVLLGAGADMNIKDKWGKTALMGAKKFGRKEIVRILKEAGAKE